MPLWLIVFVLGIVEGITEFLPVSSTGHLLIAEGWMHSHQSDLFNIVIQSGAVLAVIPLFRERFHQFLFKWRDPETQAYAGKLMLAFVLTGIGGLLIDKHGFKLPEKLSPIAIALVVGGLGFVLVEAWLKGKPLGDRVSWTIAVAVGLGQLLAAVFPGTSRSGATILLCLLLGLNRPAATEFCFLVGIPTMLAAGGWKIFKALRHPIAGAPAQHWDMVVLGFVLSAVVSFITVKWLLRYIQTHTFVVFGWYRIALAGLIGALLLLPRPTEPGLPTATASNSHPAPALKWLAPKSSADEHLAQVRRARILDCLLVNHIDRVGAICDHAVALDRPLDVRAGQGAGLGFGGG